MALIKCKECGKDVSSEAKQCPNCGAPIKKSRGCGIVFISFLCIVLGGMAISILLDGTPKAPPASIHSLHYNLSETDLGVQEQKLGFVETAAWYGGEVETGEVFEQYVNVVIAAQRTKRETHKPIVQFYKTRYIGCQHMQITFYPSFKSAPRTKDEWSKSTRSDKDKCFAIYIFDPINKQDTVDYLR